MRKYFGIFLLLLLLGWVINYDNAPPPSHPTPRKPRAQDQKYDPLDDPWPGDVSRSGAPQSADAEEFRRAQIRDELKNGPNPFH